MRTWHRGPSKTMKHFFKSISGGVWISFSIVVVLAVAVSFSVNYWGWLGSNANTIRVIALVVGGVIAVILALWRSMIAERQASAARSQSATAQLSLLNERYQKGAEMLGNKVLAARLGGIYALRRLAEEHPQEYHVQIMRLFCAFVRRPTELGPDGKPSLDVKDAMEAIAFCSKNSAELEINFRINFEGADLRGISWHDFEGVNLVGANVSSADLSTSIVPPGVNLSKIFAMNVNLSDAYLVKGKLCEAFLMSADLTGAQLNDVDLSEAFLRGAILTKADLRGVRGLTQAQLDDARADPNNPPNLEGVRDTKTNKYLTWQGKPEIDGI